MHELDNYYTMHPLEWEETWGYYTYIGYNPDTRLYKIGASGHLKTRQQALRQKYPNFFMFAATPRYIERDLHSLLKKYRIEGEWFDLNGIIHLVLNIADFQHFASYYYPYIREYPYLKGIGLVYQNCIWPSEDGEPKNYTDSIDFHKRNTDYKYLRKPL